jgi:hypothetical protein
MPLHSTSLKPCASQKTKAENCANFASLNALTLAVHNRSAASSGYRSYNRETFFDSSNSQSSTSFLLSLIPRPPTSLLTHIATLKERRDFKEIKKLYLAQNRPRASVGRQLESCSAQSVESKMNSSSPSQVARRSTGKRNYSDALKLGLTTKTLLTSNDSLESHSTELNAETVTSQPLTGFF